MRRLATQNICQHANETITLATRTTQNLDDLMHEVSVHANDIQLLRAHLVQLKQGCTPDRNQRGPYLFRGAATQTRNWQLVACGGTDLHLGDIDKGSKRVVE